MKLICCAFTVFLSLYFRGTRVTLKQVFLLFLLHYAVLEAADAIFPGSGPVFPLLLTVSAHDIRTGEIPDICHVIIILRALANGIIYPADALALFLMLAPLSAFGLLGFGDVKLLASLTLLSGRAGWMILPLACIIALPPAIVKRDKTFPFAPFISLSFAVILLFQRAAG